MRLSTFLILPAKLRYYQIKMTYSASLCVQKEFTGEIIGCDTKDTFFWRNVFIGKMTYLYRNEGEEMAPTIPGKRETLLIRKLPCPNYLFRLAFEQVSVGDVVLIKNPLDSDKFLVRRLVGLGGHEIVSTDKKDEPFVIDADECWVLSENKELKSTEANDSRTFGPVSIMNIMGRVIYRFQSMKDHGPVKNNHLNTKEDATVLKFEVELDEMQKISEA